MKRSVIGIMSITAMLCTTAMASQAAQQLPTKQDKLSYAMGVETGKAFKSHGVTVNPKAFAMGLKDGMMGNKTLLSNSQIRSILTQFQKDSLMKFQEKMKKAAMQNKQAGLAFLAANKKKPGIMATDSGLQYKVLKKGTGPMPKQGDIVTVNYEGRLLNGKVFDSSYRRGKPATFPVSGVIKGWQQALMMMHQGGTWEIFIPPQLAYGMRGAPGVIGPNETLVFKVHLISVKNKG